MPSSARHLHLVRPPTPADTGDPCDQDVEQLIADATAWRRVEVEPAPEPVVQPDPELRTT